MSHALYEIWEADPNEVVPGQKLRIVGRIFRWRAQLNGNVGYFLTREAAETHVAAVKEHLNKQGEQS